MRYSQTLSLIFSHSSIIPAVLLSTTHLVWLLILAPIIIITFTQPNETASSLEVTCCEVPHTAESQYCPHQVQSRSLLLLYAALYSISILLEVSIIIVSLKGSVIDDKPRQRIRPLLYIKQGLLVIEILFLCFSTKWLSDNAGFLSYRQSSLLAGIVITDTVVLLVLLMFTWCAWDKAGRDWVKLKTFQENSQNTSARSVKEEENKISIKT